MSHTPETETADQPAARPPAPDDLVNLRRFFAQVLLDQASVCTTAEDLREALGHVMWLSAVTNRLLGAAVLSYANGGELPKELRLTLSRRAISLLDQPGHRVPGDESGELTGILLQALMAERAANYAVNAAHRSALELP